ncbi:Transcriptional regulator, AraC family [Arcticibacter svalbardensis MN12-7]|uniref:Transcriptional regulator, AraC family n=1 Tax=Arcticibacter svalbardensis MN12-7 TaxID=1150600 RepID=R9H6G8_9SPHI|nr:AraC family transcriptional regulator [Arcticibacter svalbardensis]EOR96754.1 Transcriptional regulator, AraC family [Arcticibacter svalbardensis MN12-7]
MNNTENLRDILSFYKINCHDPFYISSGNSIFKLPEVTFRMDFYAVCICISGTIHLAIDNQEYDIIPNVLLISAPSTVVRFITVSDDFKMKLLFFEKTFLLKNNSNPFFIEKIALFSNTLYRIVPTDAIVSLRLLGLLAYLHEKTTVTGRFTEDIIRTIIINLLLEIAEVIHINAHTAIDFPNQSSDHIFYKFNQLVQKEILNHQSITYYADKLFVSNKHLIKIVKKTSGKTPHHIMDENLLKEAYVMLGNPDVDITEIAYRLNFSSVSAFSRFFKKYAAFSPSEYKKQQTI